MLGCGIDCDGDETRLPFAGAERLARDRHRHQRSGAQHRAFGLQQEDVEEIDVSEPGRVAAVRIGARAERNGQSQKLRRADEADRRQRQCAAQQHVVSIGVAVEQLGIVLILDVEPRRRIQWIVALVGIFTRRRSCFPRASGSAVWCIWRRPASSAAIPRQPPPMDRFDHPLNVWECTAEFCSPGIYRPMFPLHRSIA